MRSGKWRFLMASLAALLLLTVFSWPAESPAATVNLPIVYTYTGVWNGQTVNLTHVTNVTVEGLSDAKVIGQIQDFHTDDPLYTTLNGESINVFTAPDEFPGVDVVHNGLQGPQPVYGTWTFTPPSQKQNLTLTASVSPSSFTVNQNPQSVTWSVVLSQPVSDGSITLSVTSPGGQTAQIESGSAPLSGNYSYTNDQLFNAPGTWTVDASWSGDSQYTPASGSTTITVTGAIAYTYTGVWNTQTITLTPVPGNLPSDAMEQSEKLQNFQTNDPKFRSILGESLNVFIAPEYPGLGLVESFSQLFTFPLSPTAPYTYTGTWKGQTVNLTQVTNVTVESLPDETLLPTQLQNFQTNDPSYTSLNGESINVFTAPGEFPGVDVVHNGLQGTQSTYGTWTFVPPAAATVVSYKVGVTSPQVFGDPFTFTVTAVDASGNTVTTADNPVALSSSTNNVDFTSAATAPDRRAWVKLVDGTVTVHAQDPVQETTSITAASWAGGTIQGSAQLTVVMGPHPLLWTPGVDLSINGGPSQRVADINFTDYLNGVKTSGQHGGFWPLGVGTTYSASWTGTLQIFWTGTYRFLNTADDTGSATITVDGQTITIPENSWTGGTNEPVAVQLKRGSYAVSVTQQETDGQGGAGDTLEWQPFWRSNLVPIPAFNFRSGQTLPGTLPNSIEFTIGSNQYVVDGTTQTADTTPFIANGRTYLAVRGMGYSLGMTDSNIVWNPSEQTATFTFDGHVVVFTLGSESYTVDGDAYEMDVVPIDLNGRICVPERYFANAFDYGVSWNAQNQEVILSSGNPSHIGVLPSQPTL